MRIAIPKPEEFMKILSKNYVGNVQVQCEANFSKEIDLISSSRETLIYIKFSMNITS